MTKSIILSLSVLLITPKAIYGQKAEKQISFACESRTHEYYIEQAGLWWMEVQKDSLSEYNWYNYFRACRNAHGTADWRSDFINESVYLKTGDSIMSLIRKYIPNTFTYYYLTYLSQGIGTENGQNLLKAYSMNPNFEGIHSSVVSYAESSLDTTLRKKANKDWHKTNYLSGQLLNYAFNVLLPLDSNAILFTQNDNDTYPLWMLQDALGIRTDVKVINIDFLLIGSYREQVYHELNIPQLHMDKIELDEYHSNWQKILSHVLANHKGKNPVYLGMTVAHELYKGFESQLYPCGLTYKFSRAKISLDKLNEDLYEHLFLLDYLHRNFTYDRNQVNVDYQNLNYLECFSIVYKHYKAEKRLAEANRLKSLSLLLAQRTGRRDYIDWVETEFK